MRSINNFGFNRSSIDLWIVIIDVVFQSGEILLRLAFEVIVSEHIANLFKMIRRLEPNKARFFSVLSMSIIIIIIIHVVLII
jgi:hypothetical protein